MSIRVRGLWADFLKCIKTEGRPICDIEIGRRSTVMSPLAALSLKLGRSVKWDEEKEVIAGDPEADKMLQREHRARSGCSWGHAATGHGARLRADIVVELCGRVPSVHEPDRPGDSACSETVCLFETK